MCLFKKEKVSPVIVGLIQAGAVVVYCSLVSSFFWFMSNSSKTDFQPEAFWGPLIMLTLLVFSASVMGIIIFGYAVVLALDNKLKTAGKVLLWTLVFLVAIGACLITIAILV
ncbi:MAG: hypothetical protein UT91_C0017G0003 [Parcubacteria group bacterium GW2011_GWA2_40_23]|nr:MAG: hypothetical protein UT91_C0017G0003 [Parcubacteria group bacterium GW2011_GWA2_40_23]